MIRSLFSAVSALENLQNGMDVIGNNIANVDTTGFKAQEANFQDQLYQALRPASGTAAGTAGATNPSDVGTGMSLAEITNDMSQGTLQNTGRTLDLAIQGNGFFAVEAPDGTIYYKRDGVFNLDANGDLVDENGDLLLGTGSTTVTPVTIQLGTSVAPVSTMNIAQNGVITYTTLGSTTSSSATIGLAMFSNPEGLARVGDNMFAVSTNSGQPTFTTSTSLANTGGFGSINSGYLESSNVNLANEFANLIVTERSYEANTKMITTSDQMLLDLLNLKAAP